MQKKSLAALVATLFAIPFAAHADVTVYGFISGGIESTKATGNGVSSKDYTSRTRVVDHNSRIGFKGFEDLGNGTKAIWQVESSLKNFENGGTDDKGVTATFGTRNTFVGLDNANFGKVYLGYSDTAYKAMTDIGLNLLTNTTADVNGSSSVYSRGETRLKNSVHYVSPDLSGFKVGLSYGVDEAQTSDSTGAKTDASRLSLAANYTLGGLQVATGWDRQNDKGDYKGATLYSGKNTSFYKLAASYKFSTGTFVGAGYEWGRFDSTVAGKGTLKQDDWTIAIGQDIGNASIKLSYSDLGKLTGATAGTEGDYKAHEWVFGGTYNLSKSTQLFGYYAKITNKKSQNANFANNAVYDTASGTPTASLTKGNSPEAVGVGMKVAF
ncbi:porin [uncultured Aquitalea sp.]|uniref:porin n=1 Tax=uncultured Aquitalea sp. TaxID=540272 RepID=UPI0025E2202A|nr:porin [uncultured Aquitalea sp.]